MEKESIKVMARNREASHEYFIEEEYEAGIELVGTEVKSIRAGTLNLKDAWCGIKDGELLVNQMHISPYDHGNRFNVDSRRPRRLLMHKREIMRLFGKVKQDGYSLIPLSVYLKGQRVKVQIGLCKGKKLYDKRDDIAKRDADRDIAETWKTELGEGLFDMYARVVPAVLETLASIGWKPTGDGFVPTEEAKDKNKSIRTR